MGRHCRRAGCETCQVDRLAHAIMCAGIVPDGFDYEMLRWIVHTGVPHALWFLSVVRRIYVHATTPQGRRPRPRRWQPGLWRR